MNRRHHLQLLASLPVAASAAPPSPAPLRAVVIGHTGRGNYGHRIEHIFRDRPEIQTVAIADAGDPKGRAKVGRLYPEARPYEEFHQMLNVEKPDLVAVCPRWTDQHHAMILAALQSGAHVFSEKPFTQTLEQADELLSIADAADLKIAVAHQMLMDPNIQKLTSAIHDHDLLGQLLEIRVYGKMDERAGAEDLIVLGTHLFDMVRWFSRSEATACSARVLDENGEAITKEKTFSSKKEHLGPLAGRQIYARFEMANRINVTYQSRREMRTQAGGWGLELIGSKTSARIFLNHPTRIFLRKTDVSEKTITRTAHRWPEHDSAYPDYQGARCMDAFNRLAVDDWLLAIQNNRQPLCSGQRATKSLEMIQAVFQSGLRQERVQLPLHERGCPFT